MPRPGSRVPTDVRLLAQVDVQNNGCWTWTGSRAKGGYGRIEVREGIGRATRRHRPVHRVSYETFVGPIPDGLDIDHTCHNVDASCPGGDGCVHRRCINPAHLEAVTARENTLRGKTLPAANATKTHCGRGHPFDADNTIVLTGQRRCRACTLATKARFRQRQRAAKVPGKEDAA